jgi:hypothetical protein
MLFLVNTHSHWLCCSLPAECQGERKARDRQADTFAGARFCSFGATRFLMTTSPAPISHSAVIVYCGANGVASEIEFRAKFTQHVKAQQLPGD